MSVCRRRAPASLALSVVLCAGAAAQVPSGPVTAPGAPPITPLKYTDDYSYLRDPRTRTGAWWEPLKFIPIDSRGWAFLTLGDEGRVRYEQYWGNNFGSATLPDEAYLRYRQMPYVSLHLGPDVRAFAEIQIAYAARSHLTKNALLDQTGVDLLQGFLDARLALGSGGIVTARAGRQVLLYGSGRLINQGPNVRFSYDGGVVRWQRGDWRVDAFFVLPVDTHSDFFDDRPDGTRRLWSVYATYDLRRLGYGSGVDLYYIGNQNERARFEQGTGLEQRQSFGFRFFGTLGGFTWDFEELVQFGKFNGDDILAWAFANDALYKLLDVPLRPFLGLRLAALSGDNDPRDHTLGTFNALNGQGGYFGENSVIGPANLLLFRAIAGFDFASGWTAYAGPVLYWRASLGDGIYALGGSVLRPDGGSHARFVGHQADAAVSWRANRNLSFNVAFSILWPGQFIRDTGPAETVKFFGGHVAWQF
jgi:hypothetical protein